MTDDMFRRDEEPVTLLGRRSTMNEVTSKDGAMSKTWQMAMAEPAPKKPRTSEDFQLFCKLVLEYENYVAEKDESQDAIESSSEESNVKIENDFKSPAQEQSSNTAETSSDDNDSFDLVTCFCGKPFAGRPMIECSKCLTWIHLRCAKVKKSEIPEIFICAQCNIK